MTAPARRRRRRQSSLIRPRRNFSVRPGVWLMLGVAAVFAVFSLMQPKYIWAALALVAIAILLYIRDVSHESRRRLRLWWRNWW